MAKRAYKLQEFVAHSGNVNCLRIGRKTCRRFLTGGDDHKVNVWSIGRPTCLMSLSGHTSPVESVAFNSAEILVLAGSSSGAIKLWDLEETKMVRTLTGHRSYCTAVEFHPFGEFFASGSMDTNLKIWDIRKKGCIHTYKGHTRGISAIRFTPDGRWVVSGGFDNVVKIWDLTAGKLLHDFKFHEGLIRSIDFHPLEFLLATGSADRTVKFWDLETFEMIGSTRREAAGVRSITFHPDGQTLFCGLDDSLKVYSWEPVICHDSVDMGWSTVGDLCTHDGKLLGGAYYENFVGIWVADVSMMEPYGGGAEAERNSPSEQKVELPERPLEGAGSYKRTNSGIRSSSPDSDSEEIKNIYVDTAGGNCITSRKTGISSPKIVVPSESKEMSNLTSQKQSSTLGSSTKTSGAGSNCSFIVPSIVPIDIPDRKESVGSRRESISSGRASTAMPLKPPHMQKPSISKFDIEKLSTALESKSVDNVKNAAAMTKDLSFNNRLDADNNTKESSEDKHSEIKIVAEKVEKISPVALPLDQENSMEALDCSKRVNAIKVVNGVAVVQGRTRSLVERFEKGERLNGDKGYASDMITYAVTQAPKKSPLHTPDMTNHAASQAPKVTPLHTSDTTTHAATQPPKTSPLRTCDTPTHAVIQAPMTSPLQNSNQQIVEREESGTIDSSVIENLMQNHDVLLSTFRSRLTKLQVVRHFWEQNDVKGAINAMRKLPDHSVQAAVVSALVQRMEIMTLDLFSCLAPVLLGLLDSEVERHAVVSLEMLLKLVAVFGSVVCSTVSAPPAVGVDLHAEKRLECCKECFAHLQNVQKILPVLIRRGSVLAKSAMELNLLLQQS